MKSGSPASVGELVGYLQAHLPWACDNHPAINDFANELRDLRAKLRAVNELNEIKPELLDVPCRKCDRLSLARLPGEDRVECGSCGIRLTEDEYRRWYGLLVPNTRGVDRMVELPKWVWDVVVALQEWNDDHPKLHAEVYDTEVGAHVMKPVEDCGCQALAAVPDEVKVQARVLADYLRKDVA